MVNLAHVFRYSEAFFLPGMALGRRTLQKHRYSFLESNRLRSQKSGTVYCAALWRESAMELVGYHLACEMQAS